MSDYLLGGGTVKPCSRNSIGSARSRQAPTTYLRPSSRCSSRATTSRSDHLADGLTDEQIGQLDPPGFIVSRLAPWRVLLADFRRTGVMRPSPDPRSRCATFEAGLDWHGHATDRGAVLLYEGEGLAQTRDRHRCVGQFHYPDADFAPSLSFERFVDLTRPKASPLWCGRCAGSRLSTAFPVPLVTFDPLVEFMTGDENGEGTELASRGLRALAQYLDVAVLVAHHSNASGERARGADFLRMRAGAHIRMERLDDGMVGLLQEKQKNAAPQAMLLQPVEVVARPGLARNLGRRRLRRSQVPHRFRRRRRAQDAVRHDHSFRQGLARAGALARQSSGASRESSRARSSANASVTKSATTSSLRIWSDSLVTGAFESKWPAQARTPRRRH